MITITDSAAKRICTIKDKENDPSLFLRISVDGGGCSGFQYIFLLEKNKTDEDRMFSHQNADVVIDNVSLTLLNGAVIDYVEDLTSAQFVIKNPNATSGCGCGNSFGM